MTNTHEPSQSPWDTWKSDPREMDTEKRIERIFVRARRELAVRELVLFGAARIWTGLLQITVALVAALGRIGREA